MLEHILVPLLKHLPLLLRKIILQLGTPTLVLPRRQPPNTQPTPRSGSLADLPSHAGELTQPNHPASGLSKHAPILLHLPRQPRLHHPSLRAANLPQPLPKEPQHRLPVRRRLSRRVLLGYLRGCLCRGRTAARRPAHAEARRIFLL